MIQSMTGYGHASANSPEYRVRVELKTVNHRYLDIQIRLPKKWTSLEDPLRKRIQAALSRGRAELTVRIDELQGSAVEVQVDWAMADGYKQAADRLRERYSLPDELSLGQMLQVPELIRFHEGDKLSSEALEALLAGATDETLEQALEMRKREGLHLKTDLESRIEKLAGLRDRMGQLAPQAVTEAYDKFRERLHEILARPMEQEDSRLLTEAALMADKLSIDEELTRLDSHLRQFAAMLNEPDAVGRKLDFLVQEMNREANTICAKCNHLQIVDTAVEVKAELEKIREQIQNIQ